MSCSLLPEPLIFTQSCPRFCFASFCPLFCLTSVCWDLQPHVPPQYWGLLWLMVKHPSYTIFPLCSHLEQGMMSSVWYVICLISPGKNEEICLMLSIHSTVLTQHEAARRSLLTLAALIYLCHHPALWEDFNSHCSALRKKQTKTKNNTQLHFWFTNSHSSLLFL